MEITINGKVISNISALNLVCTCHKRDDSVPIDQFASYVIYDEAGKDGITEENKVLFFNEDELEGIRLVR